MSSNLSFCAKEVKKHDYYRYLCCLLAPDTVRENFFSIYAFNNEIAKIKDIVSEPMAGHIRLQWWRDAIEEIYNGPPVKHNHKIITCLYDILNEIDIAKELFDNLIDAREADIEFNTPDNLASIKNYAIGTSSNLFSLLLAVAEVKDPRAKEAVHHAGIAYALTGIMRSMKYNAYHNTIMFPKDLMKKQGITADDITQGKNLDKTKVIARMLCDKAEVDLHHARALVKGLPKQVLSVLLPMPLVEVFLKRIKKHDYDLFTPDLEKGHLEVQMKILMGRVLGRF